MHIPCGNLQCLSKLSCQAGDVLRGDAREKMIVIGPFRNRSMAFQAAMGDDRAPVDSLGSYLRLPESVVRLPFYLFTLFLVRRSSRLRFLHRRRLQSLDHVFADLVLAHLVNHVLRSLKRDALLLDGLDDLRLRDLVCEHPHQVSDLQGSGSFRHVLRLREIIHEKRQWLVFDLDGAQRITGRLLIHRGHYHNVITGPVDLRPRILDNVDGLDSRHGLGYRGIDAHHLGVGERTAQHLAIKHSRRMHVVGVLGAAGSLIRAIEPRNALADQAAFARFGPVIIRHHAPFPIFMAASTTAARTPMYVPQRQKFPPSARCTSS